MTRQLNAILALSSFLLCAPRMVRSAQGQAPQNPGGASSKTRKPAPVMDQMTNIPYFTLRDGMSSTLTLNNNASSPTPVTVTIYNMEGKAQMLNPITVDPHSYQQIDLRDLIVSEEFSSGNIEVAFNGIAMGVTCQVSVSNPDKRVSFESREQDMMDFNSSKLNGILSLPQANAEGFLAVTNTSRNKLTVQVVIGSKQETATLYSRETRLLKLSEQFDQHGPAAALVRLQHSGLPGDIITTGYVLNLKDGYSSSFAMVDPAIMRSTHLAGAHLRIGEPDPSEGIPEGTEFRSPLLLANVGTDPVSAHVSLDYTVKEKPEMSRWDRNDSTDHKEMEEGHDATENKFNTVNVKTLKVAPGEVVRVELSEALEKFGLEDRIIEAGVDVDYKAPPGTLIGHLVSVDQSGDYSFEVPIKDPSEPGSSLESAYPWTLENDTNTVLHLKNTTENSVSALVSFAFSSGENYQPDRIILEPYQSVAIDIQKLRKSSKPDILGHVFPTNVTHGQVRWIQESPSSMIGRAEQTNIKSGIAKSFSCDTGCCTYYYLWSYDLHPSSVTGVVGNTQTFTTTETYQDCGGYQWVNWPYQEGPPLAWWTSNSNVVTASDSGGGSVLATYVGKGQATVTGDFPVRGYDTNEFGVCKRIYPDPNSLTASAQVAVNCGNDIDNLIPEYPAYVADFIPGCADFTNSSSSLFYSFGNFNISDASHYPGWAILRGYFQSNVDTTISQFGAPAHINSGYRSPQINYGIDPTARGSRHIHGDAVDWASTSTTWDNLAAAAKNSTAACIEPRSATFPGHVHADWRGSCPPGY